MYVAALSTADEYLPPGAPVGTLRSEFLSSMKILGVTDDHIEILNYPARLFGMHRQQVLDDLILLSKRIQPDIVFIPASPDQHQDHQVVHKEALRAYKDTTIWAYELPWNNLSFPTQAFVVLQEAHLDAKWAALQQYKSQFELKRYYFSRDVFESLARVRGTQVKERWAESFEVVKMKI